MVRLDNWGGEGGVRNPFWGARCSTGNGCGCYLDTIDIVVRRITYVMMIPYIAMCCESVASGQSLHMLLCFFSLCASVVYTMHRACLIQFFHWCCLHWKHECNEWKGLGIHVFILLENILYVGHHLYFWNFLYLPSLICLDFLRIFVNICQAAMFQTK